MLQLTRAAVLLTAALVFASACTRAGGPAAAAAGAAPRIGLNLVRAGSDTVDVVGLPADDLFRLQRRTMTRDEWRARLRVTVAGGADPAADRPAVLGTYNHRRRRRQLRTTIPVRSWQAL